MSGRLVRVTLADRSRSSAIGSPALPSGDVARTRRPRLRGTRLVAAPLALVGVLSTALAVAAALWGAWHPDELGASFAVVLAAFVALGTAGFVAARGCFVEPRGEELRDVVAWVTVRRVPRARVVEARVRAGAWRWFELELDDGTLVTLLGASPAQLPARLLPGWRESDLADLAVLRGRRDAVG